MLLGARGLQGLGAAIASPAALALITTTFPAGPQRNRAFAVYAAMSGVGAAVGLILGGWLTGLDPTSSATTSTAGGCTFLINVPIGLAAAFCAPRAAAPSPSRTRGELDLPGALTGTLGLLGDRLRPHPGRQPQLRLGRHLDPRLLVAGVAAARRCSC